MRKQLNEYLFYEFGFDLEEENVNKISENWPFILEEAGMIEAGDKTEYVFIFEHEGEKSYAIYGRALDFFPIAGMNLTDLRRQFIGATWIASKKPINLSVVRPDDPIIPSTSERRRRIEELARIIDSCKSVRILEGLFLKVTNEYIGLVQFSEEQAAHVVGDKIRVRNVPFHEASASRRLSIAIGKMIEDGKLV